MDTIQDRESIELIQLRERFQYLDYWDLADTIAKTNDADEKTVALSVLEKKLKNLDKQSIEKFLDRQNNREVRAMCVAILTRNGIKATMEIGKFHRIRNFAIKLFRSPSA